jgi:hypothetical protein
MLNIEIIRKLAKNDQFIISNHARVRIFQRNISTDQIKHILLSAEIIEEYPDDKPCPSALMLEFIEEEPFHLVVGQCTDHLRIITVYQPDKSKWIDYKIRR